MSEFTADVDLNNIPPPTRAAAKAAGLTVYTSSRQCIDKAHGRTRRVSDNKCIGCLTALRAMKESLRATAWDALKQAARKAVERELKKEERLNRKAEAQEDRVRLREEEKVARQKERARTKRQETKGRQKAERTKQQQQAKLSQKEEPGTFDSMSAPWD